MRLAIGSSSIAVNAGNDYLQNILQQVVGSFVNFFKTANRMCQLHKILYHKKRDFLFVVEQKINKEKDSKSAVGSDHNYRKELTALFALEGGNLVLVTDGIHQVEGVQGANVYLVTGTHLFLVDSGLPGQEQKICSYLRLIGVEPTDVHGIVLTHFDVDHVGSVLALQKLTKCPLYAHTLEIPYILGQVARPGVKRWLPLATRYIYGKLNAPSEIHPLENGDIFEDWEIIHTPGHTPGHLILYRNGIAIVGDLFQGGNVRLAPRYFTWDTSVLRKSTQTVIERPLRWILPGHGPATPASSHWLESLK